MYGSILKRAATLAALICGLTGCGSDGKAGPQGTDGEPGPQGADGAPGADGRAIASKARSFRSHRRPGKNGVVLEDLV